MLDRWHLLGIAVAISIVLAAAGSHAPGLEAQPSSIRVAVVESVNEVATYGEAHALLPQFLAAALREAPGGRLQVVNAQAVRDEMVRRRWSPQDLVGLTNAAALGQAVGADVVVSWWIIYFNIDSTAPDRDGFPGGGVEVTASVHMRALDVATRRRIVDDDFNEASFGQPKYQAIRQVLERLAQKAARAIAAH